MINIELNKRYSTTELAAVLGISKDTLKRKKEEYLAQLDIAYEYEIDQKGRAIYYTFTKQIGEYEKPLRKNNREKTNKVVRELINKTIEKDPKQTAANINRIIWIKDVDKVVPLNIKQSTTGEYIKINLRQMYGTQELQGGTDGYIEKKIWCCLDKANNCYIEMTQEQLDLLHNCFSSSRKDQKDLDMNICADYRNGLINRKEMRDRLEQATLNTFFQAESMFKEETGYWPVRVPVYIKKDN